MSNPEKVEPAHVEDASSIDKGQQYGNLNALAHAAATERALTPWHAVRVYWKATFWCLFMCMGALLWGYDSQVSRPSSDAPASATNDCIPLLPAVCVGRRWSAQCALLPA